MRAISVTWFCAALLSILISDAAPAVARINVNLQAYYSEDEGAALSNIEKWDLATGKKILRYSVIGEYDYPPESVNAITMGPDGYLYTLGHYMDHLGVLRLDPFTGLTSSICCAYFSGGGDIGIDFNGDLIATGQNYWQDIPGTSIEGGDAGMMRRFDGQTGALKDEFELMTGRYIGSFDFAPNNLRMFALESWGVDRRLTEYSYSSDINSFQEHNTFVLGTSYNDIWIGPDELIYLRDYYNGGIDRFTQSGDYLDRFTDESVIELNWIEGKLLALVVGSRVVEINPLDGSIIATLIDASLYTGPGTLQFYHMAAFSVVPEPSAVCLLMCCLSAITVRPLSRQWL